MQIASFSYGYVIMESIAAAGESRNGFPIDMIVLMPGDGSYAS